MIDPARITLMGQSAGAVSTEYMGMVPQLEGDSYLKKNYVY